MLFRSRGARVAGRAAPRRVARQLAAVARLYHLACDAKVDQSQRPPRFIREHKVLRLHNPTNPIQSSRDQSRSVQEITAKSLCSNLDITVNVATSMKVTDRSETLPGEALALGFRQANIRLVVQVVKEITSCSELHH